MARRSGQAKAGGRTCLTTGCGRRVRVGEAFCRGCGRTAEAVAFRTELRGVTAHLERVTGVDPARAAVALGRLGRRAARGEFVGWLRRGGGWRRSGLWNWGEVARRVVAAHAAMVRAVVEEGDVVRMSATMVRGAREAMRARGGVKG